MAAWPVGKHSQFLAQGTACLSWAATLNVDGFDEVNNTARIFDVILLAGENFDLYGYGRIWFLRR